eukprot:TRINITY_DN4508_c0_g1_i2.p1 TRINITY_DN4508_c0_g1~~TRINITY_DN4508_c0_g1_i2.p1  ORF type:complete len:457 (-),score=89.63 TRINITY_DN4508_c0_g1_i2:14-1384(-)
MLIGTISSIDFGSKSRTEDDIYMNYVKVKEYVAQKTKNEIAEKALEIAPKSDDKATIDLARHKAFVFKASGMVDHSGEKTIFGQVWSAIKDKTQIFQKRAGNFPYHVHFQGEGGIDAGGLFRESVDQMCEEIQSTCLPLFIPTPNNKTSFGPERDKWTINPSSKQPTHMQMFEFLGAYLGMSFRTGHVLAINLSSLFWKQLLGDPVDKSDLKAVDAYCTQCIDDIATIEKKGVDESSFESIIDLTFVTRLSDGSEYELKKAGRSTKVTFGKRMEYVRLVEQARLNEGALQMKAIKTGMEKVISLAIVKIFSAKDIEEKICGKPNFKVEALKKITRYHGCKETDSHIMYFWQALEEFTDQERSLYLRFVWGRSRMPSATDKYTHSIAMKHCTRPDDTLPVSHTCGFQLDLPKYSSVAKTKEKVLYAIRFCQSIDGDQENFQTWEDQNNSLHMSHIHI